MTWQQALAAAAVLGVMVIPAHADDGLPPPQYDIGGATEAETIVNYIDRFGTNGPPLISVPYLGAKAECDRINYERFGAAFPAGNDFMETLLGCLIFDKDNGNPIIVYSNDMWRPGLAGRILRHEIGHLMGWPGDHPR